MNDRHNRLFKLAVAAMALAGLAAPSRAVTYQLTAAPVNVTLGGQSVTLWGYGLGAGTVTVPGPRLTVPPGDTTLTIILTNNLPEPTSLVIPGLQTALSPVMFAYTARDSSLGRQRVRAFVNETAAGGQLTYTWNNVKPGTYLYHSGSHVQKQLQMGLYGAVTKDAAAGQFAYPGVHYDSEAIVFLSDVDPAFTTAVTGGLYGVGQYTSTFVRKPRYFLINGASYTPGQTPLAAGGVSTAVLLRFLNTSLDLRTPVLQGGSMAVIAEDGNPYPAAPAQLPRKYMVELPPLKTKDALWTPGASGVYAIYDRALGLTTNGEVGGGMLVKLAIGAAPSAPVANDDAYSVAEDPAAPLTAAAPGVLGNDTPAGGLTARLVSGVSHGALTLNADGSFSYTPAANYNGADLFTYVANGGAADSNTATVRITVTAVNDAPTAANDAASTTAGTAVTIPVIANDGDIDGNPLTVTNLSAVSPAGAGTAVLAGGGTAVLFTPAAGFTGQATFTYAAFDGALPSGAATVTVTVNPAANNPPVAADDFAETQANRQVVINVLANDTDSDGTLVPSSVAATKPTMGGTVAVQASGAVQYTPRRNFRGTDTFTYTVRDNQGATSNAATVRVNVK